MDQEPALTAVQKELARKLPDIALENSPVGEPASNGAVENAVGRIKGMVRTLQSALESRLGRSLPSNSPAIKHMVGHAASLRNKFNAFDAGGAPLQRAKGANFIRDVPEVSERVLCRVVGAGAPRGKLDSNWGHGTFVA